MNYGENIVSLLKQVSTKLERHIKCYFSDCELTVPQMAVIALLYENGEMKISDISNEMGLTNGTTSGIIDRLERIGLVNRLRHSEDRRVVKVLLTDKAKNLEQNFNFRLENCFINLFDKVCQEDIDTIIKGLIILNTILDKQKIQK